MSPHRDSLTNTRDVRPGNATSAFVRALSVESVRLNHRPMKIMEPHAWSSRGEWASIQDGLFIGLLFAVSILPHTSAARCYISTTSATSLFINYIDYTELLCALTCPIAFLLGHGSFAGLQSHSNRIFNGSAFRISAFTYHVLSPVEEFSIIESSSDPLWETDL